MNNYSDERNASVIFILNTFALKTQKPKHLKIIKNLRTIIFRKNVFLVLDFIVEHSSPWSRKGLFSKSRSLVSDFFLVFGFGLGR